MENFESILFLSDRYKTFLEFLKLKKRKLGWIIESEDNISKVVHKEMKPDQQFGLWHVHK